MVTLNEVVRATALVTLQQSLRFVGVATTLPPVTVGATADEHGTHMVTNTLSVTGH